MNESDVIADLTRADGDKKMRPEQERGIVRILDGMGFDHEGPEVDDLLYRVGASKHAWRYRALTVAEANTVLEILARFYESKARPGSGRGA